MKVATKRKIKIVADSSSDVTALNGVDFGLAPLKIITAEKEYIDTAALDAEAMAKALYSYKGKSSTSCPNTADWTEAFGDAELIFCLTITATLSGSYNSAMIAKREYEEAHPDRRVFVFNSLTTGPEMGLMIEKICELLYEDKEFDEICRAVEEYSKDTGLLFVLESLKNLANNGRVSAIVAKMAGILGIRLVGKASEQGDLEPLSKCRGERKAVENVIYQLDKCGYKGGKIRIGHCLGEGTANDIRSLVIEKYPNADVTVYKCRGLCSFYAEKGGVLIGFEKGLV